MTTAAPLLLLVTALAAVAAVAAGHGPRAPHRTGACGTGGAVAAYASRRHRVVDGQVRPVLSSVHPFRPRLSRVATATLIGEITRRPGPRQLLAVGGDDRALRTLLAALMPGDVLTVVLPDETRAARLRDHLDNTPGLRHLGGRVKVADAPATGARFDAGVALSPVRGSGAAALVAEYRPMIAPGGVLSLATPLDARAAETVTADAVRTETVLRNAVPLRVHHLVFGPTDPVVAETVAPAYSPSSVPLTRGMAIDSNGVAAGALLGGAALLARRARPNSRLWLAPAVAALPVALFFRDPRRLVPGDEGAVVSSADGTVLKVQRLTDERFGPGEWLRIAVFLSVLDVHVNRSPVAGRVVDILREEGGYAMAQSESAEHNVACYTVLETARGPVVVAQRTGLIARRIVHRAPIGRLLARGERYGLIRFGSRTDVYLPGDAVDALVGPGDRVVGGETVLARYR
jgi:phosphatidylserine decarboxylase